ncbi:ribosome silencing factor [Pricia sp. S334]|uniref:Ribosomal silencing factor RsfS n=1 Tax=Pricia mediterranea TaxID=3076079 RepID=A0ABU3L7D2_9FLAO|nr:ribosome silencing factor [Pricia sp. S334]MDT7829656.1 ribosome silencing factor [Pricia sp. S334]
MQKSNAGADELIALILEGIEEVKGHQVKLLDLRDIENTVCDYFIICNGTSNTHVNAIVSSIRKIVGNTIGDKPWHVEGEDNAEWILMDYVNVVVHVFQKQIREYYDIEGLWGDAKVTEVERSLNQ